MRTVGLVACVLAIAASSALAADEKPAVRLEHPGEVALIDEGGKLVYRQFPTQNWLYVFGRETADKLGCVKDCIFRWPPVYARAESTPTGDWTLVARDNGRRQWAYKGHPVYTRVHDSLDKPMGAGAEAGWTVLTP